MSTLSNESTMDLPLPDCELWNLELEFYYAADTIAGRFFEAVQKLNWEQFNTEVWEMILKGYITVTLKELWEAGGVDYVFNALEVLVEEKANLSKLHSLGKLNELAAFCELLSD